MDIGALIEKIKRTLIGKAHNPYEQSVFHKIALIAFFAWVGLGSDGMSSSCYGPQEAYLALGKHIYLSIFVALGTAITIFIISASYSQIIELFPSGGGGYLVASKLLAPGFGMASGSALMIDYVLTITVSVASGADALFSFLPHYALPFKLEFEVLIIIFLIILNLRGAKESVVTLVPIFIAFLVTHIFIILYSIGTKLPDIFTISSNIGADISSTRAELGFFGLLAIILRAYSMGAGTYTGIEAVSNGLPILREPRVKTAKRTMLYMAWSLTFLVVGLMLAYLLNNVSHDPAKTLNASLFESITSGWGSAGRFFVIFTLITEGALLFVAAQTGFLDGPRVLSNMAIDRWLPSKFKALSDRFVNKNGIVIMGMASLAMVLFSRGSVTLLVVLYSINVFITFSLSQAGMVRHWWNVRKSDRKWAKRITINGIGFLLTFFILISMIVIKFHQGGWVTLIVTGSLMAFAALIKNHYSKTAKMLGRLDTLVDAVNQDLNNVDTLSNPDKEFSARDKTAVILVNGFNGLGLHTLFSVNRLFGGSFKNFIFLEVAIIDSGNFKGVDEIDKLEAKAKSEIDRYVTYMRKEGYHADGIYVVGTDVMEEISAVVPRLKETFQNSVFFGGQLVFPDENIFSKWLHNYTVFALQRKFYSQGIPFVLLPIRI